jgi:hypothetical protein
MNTRLKMFKIGEPNYYGTTYTKSIVDTIIEQFRCIKESGRPILGELCIANPISTKPNLVSLENVSHEVKEMWIEDNELVAEIKVFETPQGKILSSILESGAIQLIIRGTGTMDDNMVVTSMDLITIDVDTLPLLQHFFI